ncbi:acyltransferase [Paenibacillus alginolyticus]|uniref:Acyltransferase n=1 Tax=Paenibacillus alginolyticus TaxID=59839 RepID=A0ABT4G924_9BACL|nr:acyltransferase [Paenibacillus alginolyticus]MCY9664532.1 acyltransferase [Paenibacillus alginolyticus]MCY9692634.1 acyltransferase [Paenibacillus alginolyticus]MEC0143842.1 acyltransferase [Paenibacillus alginolyticus]
MRRYYPGITMFKLFGCLLVLLFHSMLYKYIGSVSDQQLRFLTLSLGVVVPCFYVVAGFLAYKGWTNASDSGAYIRRNIMRILLMYIPFCLLFIAESIVPELIRGGFTFSNLVLQAKILAVAVVLNGPSVQLWFIPPLLFSLFICYWLYKRRGMRIAVIVAILGFLLSLLISGSFRSILVVSIDGYPPHDSSLFEYMKLFIYRYLGLGFTFVLTGMIIAKYEEKFYQTRVWTLIIPTLILSTVEFFYLFWFTEWSIEYKITVSILPNTILFFYWLIHIKSLAIKTYHNFINLFSVVTFCGHILLMRGNLLLLNWDVTEMKGLQDLVYLTLTFMECLIATIVLYKVLNKRSNTLAMIPNQSVRKS